MTKITLVKVGRFYEIFGTDAMIMNKEFDVPIMKNINGEIRTGFPDTVLDKWIDKLKDKKYEVLIK